MLRLRLKDGAPDSPDTGDWDAICSTPSPDTFFSQLFREVANFSLPGPTIISEEEDDIRRIQIGWRGSPELGAEVTVVTCTETTDLPVYCTWETHGLPGLKIKWHYALDYAGQLGHVAFRHINMDCTFDSPESSSASPRSGAGSSAKNQSLSQLLALVLCPLREAPTSCGVLQVIP